MDIQLFLFLLYFGIYQLRTNLSLNSDAKDHIFQHTYVLMVIRVFNQGTYFTGLISKIKYNLMDV